MAPKIRSPLATWFFTTFTGGIYLPFWVWNIANELNTAERRTVLKVDIWRKTFLFLIPITLVSYVIAVQAHIGIPFLITIICWPILFVYVQLSIGNYIKVKDAELNTGKEYSNSLSVVLFWFVANTGIPYMQSGINRIITHEREKS